MGASASMETPCEPSALEIARALSRDPVFRLGGVVGGLSLAPSLFRILPADAVDQYARYVSDIPLILLVVLAFQLHRRGLERHAERRFWNVLTLGLGSWLFVKVLDLVVPLALAEHPYLQLVRSAGFTGLYLAFAAGLEVEPHSSDTPKAAPLGRLETKGAIALALGFFAYFALIPSVLARPLDNTVVPHLLVYLMLDVYLLVRLAFLLASPAIERGWRLSYGCLLLAVVFWAGTDAADLLGRVGLMDSGTSCAFLDVLWLPPFLTLITAARLRHGPAARPAGLTTVASVRHSEWREPLILQAAALPLVHLAFSRAGALESEWAGAQEVCAVLTGLVIGGLALVHQRRMEVENERLVAARLEAAEAASRTKSQFLANMSHELRTPLNGVLGAADLLLRSALNPAQQRLGEILRLSAQSLQEMVSDVLDFSRIEAGRLELETVALDPARLVREVATLLGPQAEAKGLEVACRVDPGLPRVLGDPTRLRQILINLASNAVKFTPGGRVELHLGREQESSDQGTLRFEVRDTGIGIASDARGRVFDVFSQADGSTTRRFGGSGLGLAISRELARLMGGDLDYESVIGVGTTFRLTVPFALVPDLEAEAFAADPQPGAAEATAAARAGEPRASVLVVDDNAVNLEIAEAILGSLGCEVRLATSGREALAAVRLERYDAVFMDCMMPEMDGYETTVALRRQEASHSPGRRTPVIALTASATREDRTRCFAAEMDDYLSKPFRREDLDAVIERWVPRSGISASAALRPTADLVLQTP